MAVETVKRVQGRPVRGAGEVGRERVVEAARSILRARQPATISRKAIAEAAGVTPALVSYYFPDKTSLVLSATRPVIGRHIDELLSVLNSEESWIERLHRVVTLFVELNEAEPCLIDHAIELCQRDVAESSHKPMLIAAYRQLRSFYVAGAEAGAWRSLDPDFFFLALWGMCRSVADASSVGIGSTPGKTEQRVAMLADFVVNGLAAR